MKKLAFISDLIFTFFVGFLFTACFFRFLRVSLVLALLLSAICGGLLTCAVAALLHSRRKKFFLKKADLETKDKLLLHLALLPEKDVTDYFLEYFQKAAAQSAQETTHTKTDSRPSTPSIKTEPKSIIRQEHLQISVDKERYFLHFRFAPVTADDVAVVFRLQTQENKILFCAQIDAQAKALCDKLHIKTHTGEEVYTLLKQADALPSAYLGSTEKKRKLFKPKLWFAKANARRFLSSAALLLFLAQLTPFFYYYLIFGIILLSSAVVIRIFGYE